MKLTIFTLCAYLVGTINPAYLIGKLRGMDIREEGSGNAGASNAVLMMGRLRGALCALFDINKAYVLVKVAKYLFPAVRFAAVLAGSACILGHIFPFWMGFRGGKGLACLGGMLMAYSWKLFGVMLLSELVLLAFYNYICLVAVTASAAFPVLYILHTGDWIGFFVLLLVAVVIFCKHLENMERIREGKEIRLSYLWDAEGEKERLKDKYNLG